MPFQSKSQRRFMYAAEARGDVPKGTAKRWEEHTPKDKPLPEKKEASVKSHLIAGGLGAALGGAGAGYLGYRAYSQAKDEQKDHYLHGMETALEHAHLPDVIRGDVALRTPYKRGNQPIFARNTAMGVTEVTPDQLYSRDALPVKTAFVRGFEKKANFAHAAELAGLGILAAPAAHELANKEQAEKFWTPKKKAIAEVSGLGVLAAPSIAHFLARK